MGRQPEQSPRLTWLGRLRQNLGALDERDFRLFFAGQSISQIGDWINRVGLLILIHNLTDAPAAVGGLMLAQILPRLFVLPFGGLLADRWSKRGLMLATDLARAALATGFLVAPRLPSTLAAVVAIYALQVLLQVGTAIFNPARSAAIPDLVPKERLAAANALVAATGQAAILLGPGLGGLIVVTWGVRAVFIANAASFLWSALLLWLMRSRPAARRAGARRAVVAELRAGLRAVAGNRPLQVCFAAVYLGGTANICLNVAIVDLLTGTLGRPAAALGPLLTFVGLGMILAGAPVVWLLHRTPAIPLIGGAVLLLGFDLVAIGSTDRFAIVGLAFAINGLLSATLDVSCTTSVQHLAPPDRLGRVFGLFIWSATLGQATGATAGGFLPALLGTPGTLVAVGSAVAIAAALAFGAVVLRYRDIAFTVTPR